MVLVLICLEISGFKDSKLQNSSFLFHVIWPVSNLFVNFTNHQLLFTNHRVDLHEIRSSRLVCGYSSQEQDLVSALDEAPLQKC